MFQLVQLTIDVCTLGNFRSSGNAVTRVPAKLGGGKQTHHASASYSMSFYCFGLMVVDNKHCQI